MNLSNSCKEILSKEGYFLNCSFNEKKKEIKERFNYEKLKEIKSKNNRLSPQDIKDILDNDIFNDETYKEYELVLKKAIDLARLMRKIWETNNKDIIYFKSDKQLINLKYSYIRNRVNFIQISVICISSIITLFESIKNKFKLTNIWFTLIPIILSSYIALILAISRFYKLDDRKEQLSKLDEGVVYLINGLGNKMRLIDKLKPLTANLTLKELATIESQINDINNDGLEETISNTKQQLEMAFDLNEKVRYKNQLFKITLDKKLIDSYNDKLNNVNINDYYEFKKSYICCIWKYLCLDSNCCRYNYIDQNGAINKLAENKVHAQKNNTLDDDTLNDDTLDDDTLNDDTEEKKGNFNIVIKS